MIIMFITIMIIIILLHYYMNTKINSSDCMQSGQLQYLVEMLN